MKPNLSKRISRPHTLGAAFGNLMNLFGVRASASDLSERWDEIVGAELANLGKLAGVRTVGKQFNIKIKPIVPAMKMELSYRLDEFRDKINAYFGYDAVGKIN